jgi:hypothetical protein
MPRSTVLRTVALAVAAAVLAPSALLSQQVTSLPGEDRPLGLEQTPVYRIGGMEATDWDAFVRVTTVAFDGAGNLHVYDAGARRLTVVSPEGRFLRQVIRSGDGPGEVTSAVGFGVSPDGEVTVVDMGRQSLARFGPDGSFRGSTPFRPQEDGIPAGALRPHPEGGFAFLQNARMVEMRPGQGPPPPPTTYPIIRIPGEAGAWTTLFETWRPVRPASDRGGAGVSVGGPGGGGIRLAGQMAPRVFEPSPTFGVLPTGGLAVADTVTWQVKLVGADGRLQRVVTRPFQPRPVTERDREEERNRRAAEIESGGGPQVEMRIQGPSGPVSVDQAQIRQALLAQVRELEFAEEMPVLDRIATDWDGRIWVARRGARLGEEGPIDILNARGGYIGTLPAGRVGLPVAFGPDGLVAFVEPDEMDVPVVRVERVRLALP